MVERKRSEGICYFCGKKYAPSELTMDHIVPLIRGGQSTKGNVVPACKDCNNKKKHMLPIEWKSIWRDCEKRKNDGIYGTVSISQARKRIA